jgi:septum formation protein
MENGKIKLILASASPRRKELLGHLKVPFEVMTLNVPEESAAKDPVKFSEEIAILKGEAVYKKLLTINPETSYFVVSADTIVYLNGKIFGKPRNRNEARDYLTELSGKTHSVFTAVSVKFTHKGISDSFTFVEESKVTFNNINDGLMERYLDTGDSLDKAGAYGIQGPSLTFISKVEGDYANVVGFPLSRFIVESEKFFKKMFDGEDLWQSFF